MAQFDVYRNPSTQTREHTPYLLDIQSDLLDHLASRVVVPLAAAERVAERQLTRLMPSVEFSGASLVMMTPQLVGVPVSALGERAGSLAERRHEIVAALDVLISGV
jgi:toxin CcdB